MFGDGSASNVTFELDATGWACLALVEADLRGGIVMYGCVVCLVLGVVYVHCFDASKNGSDNKWVKHDVSSLSPLSGCLGLEA